MQMDKNDMKVEKKHWHALACVQTTIQMPNSDWSQIAQCITYRQRESSYPKICFLIISLTGEHQEDFPVAEWQSQNIGWQ